MTLDDGPGVPITSDRATATLNLFRDGLDARPGDGPIIPRVEDEPWKFTTRQLRRTIAWYIANRPFGTIAGKIQYKHASMAMFEGYAGSARAEFRLAVERERALGQLATPSPTTRHFFVMKVRRDQAPRACDESSPGCRTSLATCQAGRWIASGCALMLAHLGRTLHVGFLNDCLFDAATALCLAASAATEPTASASSRCSPIAARMPV